MTANIGSPFGSPIAGAFTFPSAGAAQPNAVYFPLSSDLFDSTGAYEMTYTGASAVVVLDLDNKYVTTPATLPPFHGGRLVRSLLSGTTYNSEDCSTWDNLAGASTNGVDSITPTSTSSAVYVGGTLTGAHDIQGHDIVISCEMRVDAANIGTNQGGFLVQTAGTTITFASLAAQTLTNGWVRYSVAGQVPTGTVVTDLRFSTVVTNSSTNTPVYFRNMMIENATAQTNTNPSEYVANDGTGGIAGYKWFDTENGNTVAANIVTEATGASISPVPRVLLQRAGTNAVAATNYRDFSTWSAFGTNQLDQTEVGIDGQPNTAWRMQDDDTGWIVTYDAPTIAVVAGRKHGATVFIKADSNTYRRVGIYLRSVATEFMILGLATDDGSMHEHTITNGKYRVVREGDWWKVMLYYDDVGAAYTDMHMKIAPALFDYAGVVTATLTGASASCIIDWAQVEKDGTDAANDAGPTGLIPGGTTRSASKADIAFGSLLPTAAGAWAGECQQTLVEGSTGQYAIAPDNGTYKNYFTLTNGTTSLAGFSGSTATAAVVSVVDGAAEWVVPYKTGFRYDGSVNQMAYNATTGTEVAYVGDKVPAVYTNITIGGYGGVTKFTGLLSNFTFYPYDPGEAQLVTDTTFSYPSLVSDATTEIAPEGYTLTVDSSTLTVDGTSQIDGTLIIE